MEAILLRELKQFGSTPRPWPEELLLPSRSEREDALTELRPDPAKVDLGRKRTLAERRTVQMLKLVKQADAHVDENQGIAVMAAADHPSATPNTLFAAARFRRSERQALAVNIKQCVNQVVKDKLSKTQKNDSKRSQIVLENTLRTVEAMYEDVSKNTIDEADVRRNAERVCITNIGLLFGQMRYENLDEDHLSIHSSATKVLKRPRRIPFALLDARTPGDEFTTPLLQGTRVSTLMNASNIVNQQLASLPALPSPAHPDQFITPVQRRKD